MRYLARVIGRLFQRRARRSPDKDLFGSLPEMETLEETLAWIRNKPPSKSRLHQETRRDYDVLD